MFLLWSLLPEHIGDTSFIHMVTYDFIGSIHHHVDSISSGHYTSKIHFTDVVYDCNDYIITKAIPCDEVSNSVYIAIQAY